MTEEIRILRAAIEGEKKGIDELYKNLEYMLSRLELLVEEYHDSYTRCS